jgi:hypothetical protein
MILFVCLQYVLIVEPMMNKTRFQNKIHFSNIQQMVHSLRRIPSTMKLFEVKLSLVVVRIFVFVMMVMVLLVLQLDFSKAKEDMNSLLMKIII